MNRDRWILVYHNAHKIHSALRFHQPPHNTHQTHCLVSYQFEFIIILCFVLCFVVLILHFTLYEKYEKNLREKFILLYAKKGKIKWKTLSFNLYFILCKIELFCILENGNFFCCHFWINGILCFFVFRIKFQNNHIFCNKTKTKRQ